MIEISDPTIGDPDDPNWQEAKRLVAELLAARSGGDDAIVASYEDVLRWAVQDRPAELAIQRLLNLLEAAIRFAAGGIALSSGYARDSEESVWPASELVEIVHRLSEAINDEFGPGESLAIQP